MTLVQMEVDLKAAWDCVQSEDNLVYRQEAMRIYKELLAAYLKHKMFISTFDKSKAGGI